MSEKRSTELRRQQITETVFGLVSAHGLKRLNLADVARRIGVVPSAIYRHYKNKDEMVNAVLDRIHAQLMGNVERTREGSKDALETIRKLLRHHVQMIRENAAIPRIIFAEDIYSGHPERKRRVEAMVKEYLGAVAQLAREGQKEGSIRTDHDPDVISVLFLGLVQPAAFLWYLSDGRFDVTRHAERAWPFFAECLRGRSIGHRPKSSRSG